MLLQRSVMMTTAVLAIGGLASPYAVAAERPGNWETRVVAAADSAGGGGISTGLLVGGIAVAFTVGLVAGESARRRRRRGAPARTAS
ncbi:MAG: hypothetical protein M3N56_00635, partial [Actinomycetota bacterium]|nr:hypothetical protein [Actinomycetota bacterium]